MKEKAPLVLFAHGKESGPWGTKIRYLAEIVQRYGAQVLSPDYADLASPDERVQRLTSLVLPPYDELVLVGSSMGGYVSTLASQTLKPTGLFLLAPAFYLPDYGNQNPVPHAEHVSIVHGWGDEVIPFAHSVRFARQHGCKLYLLAGDHRLNGVLPDIGAWFADFLGRDLGWPLADSAQDG